MKVTKKFILIFLLLGLVSTAAAQAPNPPQSPGNGKNNAMAGPRRHMATILFAGLGGAVLGLSTLSFYGRPQDKLSNIAMGFAIGVFAGTCYVTYKAINTPSEFYGENGSDRPRYDILQIRHAPLEVAERPYIPISNWTLNF